MKRFFSFLVFIICLPALAAPWDLKVLPNVISVDAYVWDAAYTPSGFDHIATQITLDDATGSYWSKAKIRVYGYYRIRVFPYTGPPQYSWGYKIFTVDVPPNTTGASANWILDDGEYFNMSGVGVANGQGEWISSGDVTLVSYTQ